jgi:hypothetical protein
MSDAVDVYNDSAQIVTTTTGLMLGTTAAQVFVSPVPNTSAPTIARFMRIWNVAASGGATVWLTRSATIGLNVAANLPGCFPLPPGEYELFNTPQAIPMNPLWAVATAANTPLTIEVG